MFLSVHCWIVDICQLNQTNKQSVSLDKLKYSVDKYQLFNNGLKETISKLVELDDNESVEGMHEDIQKQKFNKIMSHISKYIFDYDFNFIDYPYLSDIVIEIIKRKQPYVDTPITDLLQKL